jgi:hypothetical protein
LRGGEVEGGAAGAAVRRQPTEGQLSTRSSPRRTQQACRNADTLRLMM